MDIKDSKIVCPFCGGKHYQPQSQGKKVVMCYECNDTGVMLKSGFSCFKCNQQDKCRSAYNAYNANGDCLEDK